MRTVKQIKMIEIFWLGALVIGLSACSWEKKEKTLDENSPVKVQIPVYTEGTYKMEVVELMSLHSLPSLRGGAAKFLIDPSTSKGQLQGRAPNLQYMRDANDVIVATDDLSLQLLTVYAHFEKLKNLEDSVGAKNVLSYPRTVAVNAKFRSSAGMLENNALYTGQYDALLVVPYTDSALPIMANAGVIGHEHFHALFQKMVVEPLGEKYPDAEKPTLHPVEDLDVTGNLGLSTMIRGSRMRENTDPRLVYHTVLMRGVNEGFADLWGWIYSGDNNFVGRSLPSEKINRTLETIPDQLFTKEFLQERIAAGETEDNLLFRSYQHGTQLARALRNFTIEYGMGKNISNEEARKKMAQVLTETLPVLKTKLENLKSDEYLTLGQVTELFTEQVKDMGSKECFKVAKLMPAADEQLTKMGEKCRGIETQEKGVKP